MIKMLYQHKTALKKMEMIALNISFRYTEYAMIFFIGSFI
jgi:hypothetical protein